MKKKTLIHIIGIILLRISLDVNYTYIIAPMFAYRGFLNQPTFASTIISWIALILFIPFIISLYNKPSKISTNVIVLLFLISFIPMTSMMKFMPIDIWLILAYIIYWFILFVSYKIIPTKNLKKVNQQNNIPIWIILVILSGSIIYVSGVYFRFRIHLNLRDVYDLRAEARLLQLPTIIRYLISAARNILPVLLVYFLHKKNKKIALLIGFIILLEFSIGGHKTVFFKLILSFIGFWFYNEKSIYKYSWILSFVSLLSILEHKIYETFLISGIFIRRVFYIPSLLNYYYYDFFIKNEPDYLRQGILRRLGFSSPYSTPIQRLIGDKYFGNIEIQANNGLFSDAFYNFNFLGVFILPPILILIFKLIDSSAKGIDSKLIALPIIVVATSFNSGSFSSVLLTNGILLLMLTLYLLPRK